MKTKLITLILALSMLLPVFASCGESNETKSSGNADAFGEGWWSAVDFKNRELTIVYPPDGVFEGQCNIYSEGYQRGPEQIGSDEVKNLCYNRNQDVCATLGVTTNYYEPTNAWVLDEWTKMAQGAPDIAYLPTNKLNNALLLGQLYNIYSQDETNYYDFTQDCWYLDFMNTFTLDKNKLYGVTGDFFISVMQAANAIFMNTEYYETYVAEYWYSLDDLVQIIEARAFTGDEFAELVERGWVQSGNDPQVTINDGIGLIAHTSTWLYPFIFSVEDYVFETDSKGEIQMSSAANLYNIIEQVLKIYKADGALVDKKGTSGSADASGYIDLFTEGNALFIEGLTVGDLEDRRLLGMEKKIAIPYPILLETQTEYRTYVSMQAQLGSILKNTHNFSACTAFLELLNEQSTEIIDEYFGYTLKFKYSTDSTGVNMLDIIHDTIGSSFNKIQSDNVQSKSGQDTRIIYIVIDSVNQNNNLAYTKYDAIKDAYKSGLGKLKAVFAELD